MTIRPDVEAYLPEARADMAALMARGRWKVTKAGEGEPVLDYSTGQMVDPPRVTVYEGPGRLQIRADINSNVVEAVVAEREAAYQTATLQLPIAVDTTDTTVTGGAPVGDPANVRNGMIAECLIEPDEPALPGRQFGVLANAYKSHATCRRLRVREVTG